MPSNDVLIKKADSLAKELGETVDTKDKSNKELAVIVKDLSEKRDALNSTDADAKAKAEAEQKAQADADAKAKAEAEQEAQADADAKAKAEAEQKAQANTKPKGPRIAKGKAITSLRGILGEGEPVKASDFPGGETTFKDLRSKGFIVG